MQMQKEKINKASELSIITKKTSPTPCLCKLQTDLETVTQIRSLKN